MILTWVSALWLHLVPPPPPCPKDHPCPVLGQCMRWERGGPCDKEDVRGSRGRVRRRPAR